MAALNYTTSGSFDKLGSDEQPRWVPKESESKRRGGQGRERATAGNTSNGWEDASLPILAVPAWAADIDTNEEQQ